MDLRRISGVAAMTLAFVACSGGQSETPRVALAAYASTVPTDTIVVYKTPTCGCCSNWVEHAREYGFTVVTHDLNSLDATKRQLGVPPGRMSCHTSTVRGYTIEGHVPADLIHRLLEEKPEDVRGLVVPGMPMGSPGMEGLVAQSYDVLAFDDRGNVSVYARR